MPSAFTILNTAVYADITFAAPSFPVTVSIDAAERWNDRWNDASIIVEPGFSYVFDASGVWWDTNIETGPLGYPSKNIIQRTSEWMRCEHRGMTAVGEISLGF